MRVRALLCYSLNMQKEYVCACTRVCAYVCVSDLPVCVWVLPSIMYMDSPSLSLNLFRPNRDHGDEDDDDEDADDDNDDDDDDDEGAFTRDLSRAERGVRRERREKREEREAGLLVSLRLLE